GGICRTDLSTPVMTVSRSGASSPASIPAIRDRGGASAREGAPGALLAAQPSVPKSREFQMLESGRGSGGWHEDGGVVVRRTGGVGGCTPRRSRGGRRFGGQPMPAGVYGRARFVRRCGRPTPDVH